MLGELKTSAQKDLWTHRLYTGCAVRREIAPGWRGRKPGRRDPFAPLTATIGTEDNRLFPFFPNIDSFVSVNSKIDPWWLRF